VKYISEGSASDSYDDNDRREGEEETDDDDNAFFDTQDFLSSSSFKSNGSDFQKSPLDSDDEEEGLDFENGVDSCITSVGSNHPYIRRRKKLPEPVEKEKGVSLWSMIKDNIGKDLTKVCLPVYFNEPLSSLQKCFEDMEYSYLLDQAYEWGKMVTLYLKSDGVSFHFLKVGWLKQFHVFYSYVRIGCYIFFFCYNLVSIIYWVIFR
jgi:hypothetical protein